MSFNQAHLLGRLGKDPELRYTQTETPVATLAVATSEYRKGKDGQKNEQTEWHNVVCFGKTAEYCSKYLSKGSKVFVEGRITTNSWDDKKTGEKRYRTDINAHRVLGLDKKEDAAAKETQKDFKIDTSANFTNDEIPF